MAKRIVTYEIDDGLPEWASPAVLRTMNKVEGKSLRELAKITGVSKEKIRQLILQDKHVCGNCFQYHKGLCACREIEDMIRGANKCPDWSPKE